MSSRIRSALSLCAAAALTVGIAVLPASGAAADETGAAGNAPAEATPANVQRFLDKRIPELLNEYNIPGATVSVVADGRPAVAGGYGEANVENGTPVEADKTSFPMASVSKTFTATAVLQLVDAGELDLDANVNKYLPQDARIPDTYPGEPVTLHHLLTHTAGFEDSALAIAATSPEDHIDLRQYTVSHKPDRIYPPGRFIGYNNYSTTLAGFIVQEVTGTEFNQYIGENIFAPLGMEESAFAQPDEAADMFDTPTLYDPSATNEAATLWVNQAPAGAGWATSPDMARFLAALLNGGTYDGATILSPESAGMVLSPQTTMHEEVTGSGYGSWETSGYGQLVMNHGGDIHGGHTQWRAAPEEDFAVYVAVNGDGTGANSLQDGRAHMVEDVMAEFVGEATAEKPEAADIPLERYVGTYRTTRINHSDVSEAANAMTMSNVTTTGDGRLQTVDLLGKTTWTPIEPNLFQNKDGDHLAFVEEDGEVIGLAIDAIPEMAFERISTLENFNVHAAAAGAALVIMLTALVWPLAGLVRLMRGRRATSTAGSVSARVLAGISGAICIYYTGFLVYLVSNGSLLQEMLFDVSPLLNVQLLPAVLTGAGVLVSAVVAWTNKWWSVGGRIHYTVITLALILYLVIAAKYGMIGVPPE
ncbi:serine hydrolase [Streptomonospora sediminis]